MDSPKQHNLQELLRLTNICLHYGQVEALKHIHLRIGFSESHAIVGEHGAGKSSIGLLMSGILQPQRGTITFEGRWYTQFSASEAIKLGICMIYQQVRLYEEFTVAENLFLSNTRINKTIWSRKRHFLDAAAELLVRYNFDIDPSTPLKNLNLSDQTVIEILRHLTPQPKLLILDEALERLSAPALCKILAILQNLKASGTSIVVITHRIDDIYTFADRVSIIKNGEVLLTDDVKNIDKINLVKMAYTQLSTDRNIADLNKEFYQLLKYNEAILQHLPVNLLVVDNHFRVKMVNDHCKLHFGLTGQTYRNMPLERFFFGPNSNVLKLLREAFSSRDGKTFYQVSLIIDDLHTVNNIRTFPIYDGSFLIGHIISIEDMTEYDQLQKQVMVSEKLASVGLLAAGVAHEINNPLGIIANHLSYIKYSFNDQALHEAVDNVQEELSSISHIVSNLHSFSENKQAVNEEFEVNALIHNILTLMKHSARHKHITIHFEPSTENVLIVANKNEIKQVILNLFKNSFEAMSSGGEIFLNTTILTEHDAEYAQIRFRDTGPGICDEHLSSIFLPFYSTKKGQDSNLGLGLSVSYGIIKKYHGTIRVENIESGCQFIITLPKTG